MEVELLTHHQEGRNETPADGTPVLKNDHPRPRPINSASWSTRLPRRKCSGNSNHSPTRLARHTLDPTEMRRKRGLNSEPDIFVGFARLHIDELMRTDMRQTTTGLRNHFPLPRRTSLAKLLSRSLRALKSCDGTSRSVCIQSEETGSPTTLETIANLQFSMRRDSRTA